MEVDAIKAQNKLKKQLDKDAAKAAKEAAKEAKKAEKLAAKEAAKAEKKAAKEAAKTDKPAADKPAPVEAPPKQTPKKVVKKTTKKITITPTPQEIEEGEVIERPEISTPAKKSTDSAAKKLKIVNPNTLSQLVDTIETEIIYNH